MTRTWRTLGLAGMVALGGVAASLLVLRSGQARLLEKAEAAGQQAEQIARLSDQNERLSNLVAQAGSSPRLPPEQLRELLKLRGQIGLLRQTTDDQAQLQATNAALRAAMAASDQQLAAARAAPNFWAKDQLAFAGYAEPEATLKTSLWAIRNGDLKTLLACWIGGPESLARLQSELGEHAEAEMTAEAKRLAESLVPAIGFHILERQEKSADEVTLKLSFDGEGKTRKFTLKRIGAEWKLAEGLRTGP